jgi:tetratricopeptide (TPR) repeat protein
MVLRRLAAAALAALPLLHGCASAPARPPQAAAEDPAPLQALKQGRDLLQAQQPQQALDRFDEAIALYEARYLGETHHLYCARSRDEGILYSANAIAVHDPAEVLVLPPYWADAYFLKGYTLNRQGHPTEAEPWLRKAQVLSPANAQYLAELGYTYQLLEDWARSLAWYRRAESAADFSPLVQQRRDLARALRGQARALAAQGHGEEAAPLYQRCLELDPDDSRARAELDNLPPPGGS